MNKTKRIIIIASAVFSLLIIVGAVLVVRSRQPAPAPEVPKVEQRAVSRAELTAADGKEGRDCYVAVDGTVYQIKDFSLWQNGEHQTSNGLAYCGADMSEVINQSPHGRRVLDLLIKIGPLQKS